jgi:hypothetical protein
VLAPTKAIPATTMGARIRETDVLIFIFFISFCLGT